VSADLQVVELSRWFLAGFFGFVAVFYTIKILAARRRTGHSPVSVGKRYGEHWRIYGLFRLFRALILLVCVARVPWPDLDRFLVPITPLWTAPVILLGIVALSTSFALILAMHARMRGEWHSGIDPSPGPRQLRTTGSYGISRNPMAILIQVGQLGLFLALPTVFTLICLVVGVLAIHRQVRLEEADLEARHGELYRAYRAQVPRWIAVRRVLRRAESSRSRNRGRAPAG
jgi:protein-S-isoprenylcysteine O-methyltransferase Ste14